ncbi:ABC transporter permease [Salibacterium halotolerans]|uniref:ABC-2 type transport system permease protein n=1 Tax=Salibacterium halotolerans TaxID=1884432 RepID=A0A1I5TTL6_9BACI|nr:ABC transporter permease subunit [Salibacterium halotolerans]SFP86383.1 ABC-2 type transport system permease protein [Salibacterium halotolerans]
MKDLIRKWREENAWHPFSVLAKKELADHIRSFRFIVLFVLVMLICVGSLYVVLSNIRDAAAQVDAENANLFLKIFTLSNGNLPPYFALLGLIGPLVGISLGFDAINAEMNKRTLGRILAQPIPRDAVINAKFTAAAAAISIMICSLSFFMIGFGIWFIGIPPTFEEFLRILIFTIVTIIYIAFWINLSIIFSTLFKQPATSALTCIAIWLFFSVFYNILLSFLAGPSSTGGTSGWTYYLSQLSPNQIYSNVTSVLLTPGIRSAGPLSVSQVAGSVPSPLPLQQSLLVIWPHLTTLIAGTFICFGMAYLLFIRKEIRS